MADTEIIVEAPAYSRRRLALYLAIILVGMILISGGARLESSYRNDQIFGDGVATNGDRPTWAESRSARLRNIKGAQLPRDHVLIKEFSKSPDTMPIVESIDRISTESIAFMAVSEDELSRLVDWGRAPIPGQAEVLAGPLTVHRKEIWLDDTRFEVVGTIQRGNVGLTRAYLLPESDVFDSKFSGASDTKQWWLIENGRTLLVNNEEAQAALSKPETDASVTAYTWPSVSYAIAVGMILVIVGWGLLQIALLKKLARASSLFRPFFEVFRDWPSLFMVIRGVLLTAWILGVLIAIRHPLANAVGRDYIGHVFQDGYLSYVGSAYAKGDIGLAAVTTFINNCLWQTYVLTLAISVVIPFAGLFKNMLSFTLASFVLAPVWTNSSDHFTLHSVTVALEIEAYILATFSACVFPCILIRGMVMRSSPAATFKQAFAQLGSCAVYVGIVLAIAALYEAVTLILFV